MHPRVFAGALALALLPSLRAAAQDASQAPVDLPPVVVPLPPADDGPAPESPQRRDPTGAISVVEVDQHAAEAKDAAELIATAPGVHLTQTGGVGQRQNLILRGASSSGVLVFLDGLPLNGAGGIADLSLLPLAVVDRFEILRGGGSYGSGGLGGVVNAVTRPVPEGARLSGELRYGSFDTAVATLGASAPLLGGQALLLVHGTRSDGDYPYLFDPQPAVEGNPLEQRRRVNNAAELGGALLKLRRSFGGWTANALVDFLAHQRGLAGTSRNPTPDAREEGSRLGASARLSGELAGAELSLRGFARAEETTFTGGFYLRPYLQRFQQLGLAADAGFSVGGWQLLSAALELNRDALPDASQLRAGALIRDELLLFDGRLTVAPSGRVDLIQGGAGALSTRDWLFSPRLGLAVALPYAFELRANLGQTERAPSMLERYVVDGTLLPNPELRPERSRFVDAGLAWTTETAHASATGFYALYDDLISYEYYPPFLARPFNFDAAQVGGAELEAAAELPWTLQAAGAYTLTFSQNLRDDARFYGKELPYRPRHKAHLRLAGGPSWARGRVELDYQSSQFMNRTQTLALPARVLLDAGVTTRISKQLSVSLEGRNLLDLQTEDFDGYPLPGRSVHLTLSATLEPSTP